MQYKLPFMDGFAHQIYCTAEDGVVKAAKSGCSHWYVDGSLHGQMVMDWGSKRIENLKQMIDTYSCKPIFHGNFKAPLASDVDIFCKAAVAYVKQEIDICSQLDAPLIVHAGAIVEPKAILKAKQIGLKNYLNSIQELSEYASFKKVDLYLENLSNYKHYRPFHYLFTNYEEYEYILENTKYLENIYFFFDFGHSNIGNDDTIKVFNDFHQRIKGVSLSNNNGAQDQHLPINQGMLKYHEIVQSMLDCNWSGLIAFETRGIDTQATLAELENVYQQISEIKGA